MAERSPEKAGVGGSTPSLATIILRDLAALSEPNGVVIIVDDLQLRLSNRIFRSSPAAISSVSHTNEAGEVESVNVAR